MISPTLYISTIEFNSSILSSVKFEIISKQISFDFSYAFFMEIETVLFSSFYSLFFKTSNTCSTISFLSLISTF